MKLCSKFAMRFLINITNALTVNEINQQNTRILRLLDMLKQYYELDVLVCTLFIRFKSLQNCTTYLKTISGG